MRSAILPAVGVVTQLQYDAASQELANCCDTISCGKVFVQLFWTCLRNRDGHGFKKCCFVSQRTVRPSMKDMRKSTSLFAILHTTTEEPASFLYAFSEGTKMVSTRVIKYCRNARCESNRKFLRCIRASSQIFAMRSESAIISGSPKLLIEFMFFLKR